MNLNFDTRAVAGYTSPAQQGRVLTESWVGKEGYCPNCGSRHLRKHPNNQPVADFFCKSCGEDFELKSKRVGFGAKIVDGAYQAMLDRLSDVHNPNLFLLNYELSSRQVSNFFVIPRHFFVPAIIEKRKPLALTARRAGWVGCNILLNGIPEAGRIFLIKDKQIQAKEQVCEAWKKTLFLREERRIEGRGWLLDVMRCIELIRKREFSLAEVYKFESMLAKQHRENRHIKAKIRQQLQVLRDKNYIQFTDRGEYRVI